MRPMKKLQYRLTLPSRENNIEDRYNDGVEGHPASRTLSVIPDKNGYICILWKEGNLDKKNDNIWHVSQKAKLWIKRLRDQHAICVEWREWHTARDATRPTPNGQYQPPHRLNKLKDVHFPGMKCCIQTKTGKGR